MANSGYCTGMAKNAKNIEEKQRGNYKRRKTNHRHDIRGKEGRLWITWNTIFLCFANDGIIQWQREK